MTGKWILEEFAVLECHEVQSNEGPMVPVAKFFRPTVGR